MSWNDLDQGHPNLPVRQSPYKIIKASENHGGLSAGRALGHHSVCGWLESCLFKAPEVMLICLQGQIPDADSTSGRRAQKSDSPGLGEPSLGPTASSPRPGLRHPGTVMPIPAEACTPHPMAPSGLPDLTGPHSAAHHPVVLCLPFNLLFRKKKFPCLNKSNPELWSGARTTGPASLGES